MRAAGKASMWWHWWHFASLVSPQGKAPRGPGVVEASPRWKAWRSFPASWLLDACHPHSTGIDQCLGGTRALLCPGRPHVLHTVKSFVYFCVHKETVPSTALHHGSEGDSGEHGGLLPSSPAPCKHNLPQVHRTCLSGPVTPPQASPHCGEWGLPASLFHGSKCLPTSPCCWLLGWAVVPCFCTLGHAVVGIIYAKVPAAEVLNTEAPQKISGCCSLLCREICEA